MAAETGFNIDGTFYEVPVLDSFDMDEAQVLYDYCGLTLEDFVPPADNTPEDDLAAREQRLKNPGFVRALIHIAYQRGNPDMKPAAVRDAVGHANMLEAYTALASVEPEEGEPEVPPASTSEQPKPSVSGSLENDVSSVKPLVNGGDGSTIGSDGPDRIHAAIGTIR